jgi:hypothetical protein
MLGSRQNSKKIDEKIWVGIATQERWLLKGHAARINLSFPW